MLTYEEYLKQQQASENDLVVDQAIGAMRAAGVGGIDQTLTPSTPESPVADQPQVVTPGTTSPAPGSDYQATMDKLGKDYTDAVNANAQDWQDYVLGIAKRNEEAEAEMRRQEEASRRASAFTGVTEVAANIANLLSVGQGHATPQRYNTYSTGWMQKADQDMRERRRHTENMRGQMDRLNYQIQQVKNADRLGDIKLKMEMAREAERKRLADEEARKKQAAADAAKQEKIAARDATMLRSGFVPDANDPSGYRFDADLARQMAEAKKAPKAAGSAGTKAAAMPAASPAAKPQATSRVVTPPAAARQSAPAPASDTTKVTKPAQATEASGNGNRKYNRTTFLPPTQKDWERGIDKRNSPQGRKKVGGKPEQKKDDWDQFKIK
jgi:hypothetical protein